VFLEATVPLRPMHLSSPPYTYIIRLSQDNKITQQDKSTDKTDTDTECLALPCFVLSHVLVFVLVYVDVNDPHNPVFGVDEEGIQ
jgi:hypothetical protein